MLLPLTVDVRFNLNSIYTARARPLEAHTLDNRAQAMLSKQPDLPHQMSQSQSQSPTSPPLLVARLGELLLEVQGLVAVDALVGDGVAHAALRLRIVVLIWP